MVSGAPLPSNPAIQPCHPALPSSPVRPLLTLHRPSTHRAHRLPCATSAAPLVCTARRRTLRSNLAHSAPADAHWVTIAQQRRTLHSSAHTALTALRVAQWPPLARLAASQTVAVWGAPSSAGRAFPATRAPLARSLPHLAGTAPLLRERASLCARRAPPGASNQQRARRRALRAKPVTTARQRPRSPTLARAAPRPMRRASARSVAVRPSQRISGRQWPVACPSPALRAASAARAPSIRRHTPAPASSHRAHSQSLLQWAASRRRWR